MTRIWRFSTPVVASPTPTEATKELSPKRRCRPMPGPRNRTAVMWGFNDLVDSSCRLVFRLGRVCRRFDRMPTARFAPLDCRGPTGTRQAKPDGPNERSVMRIEKGGFEGGAAAMTGEQEMLELPVRVVDAEGEPVAKAKVTPWALQEFTGAWLVG